MSNTIEYLVNIKKDFNKLRDLGAGVKIFITGTRNSSNGEEPFFAGGKFDKFIGNFLEINACSEKPAMIQVKSIDTTGENLKLLESIRDLPPTNKHARTYNLKTFKDYNIYIVEMTDINLTN